MVFLAPQVEGELRAQAAGSLDPVDVDADDAKIAPDAVAEATGDQTHCAAEIDCGPGLGVVDLKVLHAKIGELTLEKDFLSGALSKAGLLSAKR